ncbi:MAG: hypothetical protein ACI94Y_002835 [Maribacter sp.]
MKISITTFILFFALSFSALAQSDSLKVSLLTYSPLPDISAAFGHSAVRVQDFTMNTDVIYNYGIFDYDEPNFVWKFLRGKLEYQLGKQRTQSVFNAYKSKGTRQISEQELDLNTEESKAVLAYLENNYLPENRRYFYDFFFDNCATRIRDIIELVLKEKMEYTPGTKANLTMRQLLDVHVASRPWTDFGMDLLVGIPADQVASYQDQMYLPSYLSDNLTNGVLIKRQSNDSLKTISKTPLLGTKKLVVDGENYMNKPHLFRPFVAFGILCLFMLVFTLAFKHNRLMAMLDGILFFLLGFVGLFLLFMWFGTDHSPTKWNLNILWANPLYLLFFIPVMRRSKKWMPWAYGIAFFMSIIVLLGWTALPQQLHTGVLPLVLLMIVRSGSVFLYLKKDEA